VLTGLFKIELLDLGLAKKEDMTNLLLQHSGVIIWVVISR